MKKLLFVYLISFILFCIIGIIDSMQRQEVQEHNMYINERVDACMYDNMHGTIECD